MPIVFDAPVAPDDQTQFIRNIPTPNSLTLLSQFPVVNVAANTVRLGEITSTNRAARYRTYDGRIHVAERDGFSNYEIAMAPFSDSLNMGEYERLRLEFLRTGGTRQAALADAIYNDADRLTRYMQVRMNLALGDTLADGKFTPNLKDENIGETDYGVPAGQIVTSGTTWATTATASPIGDLVAVADAIEANGEGRPTNAWATRNTIRQLRSNTSIINMVKGAQTGSTRVSLADMASVFEDEGIPSPENWTIVEDVADVDGVTTRAFPNDRVVLGPPPEDLMEFRLGLSATALELVQSNLAEMSFEDAAGIVGVVEKVGPPYRQFTFVDAVGMPVIRNARRMGIVIKGS